MMFAPCRRSGDGTGIGIVKAYFDVVGPSAFATADCHMGRDVLCWNSEIKSMVRLQKFCLIQLDPCIKGRDPFMRDGQGRAGSMSREHQYMPEQSAQNLQQ